jgi:hypothetical protein
MLLGQRLISLGFGLTFEKIPPGLLKLLGYFEALQHHPRLGWLLGSSVAPLFEIANEGQ